MWEVIKQFKILLTFSVIVIGLAVFALYQYFMVALYII
jgi:hypothetical protein